jgi:hypothetical protein
MRAPRLPRQVNQRVQRLGGVTASDLPLRRLVYDLLPCRHSS